MKNIKHKTFICLGLLFLVHQLTCLSNSQSSSFQSNRSFGDAILEPGKGFSTDTQQISAATCYNIQIGKRSNSQSIIKLNQGSTYSSIVNTFGIDVSAKMSFAMFAGGASFNYLRSIQTTTSSFSITYFHLIERDISLNFNSSGVLNDIGKMIYQDGLNPVFRIACGDQILTSYRQSASLFFSFNLYFNNKVDKQIIQAKLGAQIGGIASISAEIQKIAIQNKIQASINLQVYQIGGDPRKIGQIISSKDPDGNYYIVKCSLTNTAACNRTVTDLINYSGHNFPTQINFDTEEGLTNFGTNNIKYISASYFGLKISASFVTQEVTDIRLQLSNYMESSHYYQENLNSLLFNYPVTWDKSSQIYNFFESQRIIAQNNIKALLNVNNPEEGSLGCYSSPQRCQQINNNIKKLLKTLNTAQISLYVERQLKYSYKILSGAYASGDFDYAFVPSQALNPRNLILIVNQSSLNATYVYHDAAAGECTIKAPSFIWTINQYQGTTYSYCEHYTGTNHNFFKRGISEYYFGLFQGGKQMNDLHKNKNWNFKSDEVKPNQGLNLVVDLEPKKSLQI